jgi:hypothetical protein
MYACKPSTSATDPSPGNQRRKSQAVYEWPYDTSDGDESLAIVGGKRYRIAGEKVDFVGRAEDPFLVFSFAVERGFVVIARSPDDTDRTAVDAKIDERLAWKFATYYAEKTDSPLLKLGEGSACRDCVGPRTSTMLCRPFARDTVLLWPKGANEPPTIVTLPAAALNSPTTAEHVLQRPDPSPNRVVTSPSGLSFMSSARGVWVSDSGEWTRIGTGRFDELDCSFRPYGQEVIVHANGFGQRDNQSISFEAQRSKLPFLARYPRNAQPNLANTGELIAQPKAIAPLDAMALQETERVRLRPNRECSWMERPGKACLTRKAKGAQPVSNELALPDDFMRTLGLDEENPPHFLLQREGLIGFGVARDGRFGIADSNGRMRVFAANQSPIPLHWNKLDGTRLLLGPGGRIHLLPLRPLVTLANPSPAKRDEVSYFIHFGFDSEPSYTTFRGLVNMADSRGLGILADDSVHETRDAGRSWHRVRELSPQMVHDLLAEDAQRPAASALLCNRDACAIGALVRLWSPLKEAVEEDPPPIDTQPWKNAPRPMIEDELPPSKFSPPPKPSL